MPDPGDQMPTRPDPDSPGAHPVLADMTEAVRLTSDAAAFLSPTREFAEPGLEESDWPRDLDGRRNAADAETIWLDLADHASTCINGIGCQHSIADGARPELDEIDQLLSAACRRLRAWTEARARNAAAAPGQHAGLDFPATRSGHPLRTDLPADRARSRSPAHCTASKP